MNLLPVIGLTGIVKLIVLKLHWGVGLSSGKAHAPP